MDPESGKNIYQSKYESTHLGRDANSTLNVMPRIVDVTGATHEESINERQLFYRISVDQVPTTMARNADRDRGVNVWHGEVDYNDVGANIAFHFTINRVYLFAWLVRAHPTATRANQTLSIQ